MLLWLTKVKRSTDQGNTFIKLDLNEVIDDIYLFVSDEILVEINNVISMKKEMTSNNESIERQDTLDNFIFDTLYQCRDKVKEVNKKENQSSNFGDIAKYDAYLFFCFNQCFN